MTEQSEVTAITPDTAILRAYDIKISKITGEVLTIINDLIIQSFVKCTNPRTAKSVQVRQEDIVSALCTMMTLTPTQVFDSGMLDFEEFYNKVGWKFTYHKPTYDESWKAYFEFSRKTND